MLNISNILFTFVVRNHKLSILKLSSTQKRVSFMIKKILFLIVLVIISMHTYAYDIEVNGLYFNLLSAEEGTVEVTYKSFNPYDIVRNEQEYIGDIEIPEKVTLGNKTFTVVALGEYCFADCRQMTSLKLPNTIKLVKEGAFGRSRLNTVEFPNSIDSICPLTFWRSYYITNVKLPENLKTIPGRMFEDCTSLVNIVIPNSVIKIGPGAFGGCSNLKTINLGNNITTIGQGGGWSGTIYGAFYGCSSLESIVIPSKVEIIPPHTFDGCKSLTFVEIPNGLKEIGNESFNGTKITSISLPKTITKIGESAFSGATSLSTIIVYNDSPISITDNVFSYNTYLTGNLYVPEGSSGLYKSSESGWCNFASILEGEPELNMTNIKMSFNEGGSIYVNGYEYLNSSQLKIQKGTDVLISIKPKSGYYIKSATINDNTIANNQDNYELTFKAISEDLNINVTFAKSPIYLTIRSADNGCVSQVVEKGKSYTFVIKPASGWMIESLSFDGVDVTSQISDNTYETPNIYNSCELNIVYKKDNLNSINTNYAPSDIKVTASAGRINILNNSNAVTAKIFDISGSIVAESVCAGLTTFELQKDKVYIVSIANRIYKIAL